MVAPPKGHISPSSSACGLYAFQETLGFYIMRWTLGYKINNITLSNASILDIFATRITLANNSISWAPREIPHLFVEIIHGEFARIRSLAWIFF